MYRTYTFGLASALRARSCEIVLCQERGARPHCLRHTYASLLLEEDGGRLLYVSRQLGHTDVSITANTYAKWIRPVGRGVVNTLAVPA